MIDPSHRFRRNRTGAMKGSERPLRGLLPGRPGQVDSLTLARPIPPTTTRARPPAGASQHRPGGRNRACPRTDPPHQFSCRPALGTPVGPPEPIRFVLKTGSLLLGFQNFYTKKLNRAWSGLGFSRVNKH